MTHSNYTQQQLAYGDYLMDSRCDGLDLPYCPGCDKIVLEVVDCPYEGRKLCRDCAAVWNIENEQLEDINNE